ncbi:MAG: TonB-dependent receptor [Pseudomonadota bacterium]
MRTFTLNAVALALLAMIGTAHAQTATELNKVTVTGEGDKLGTGLLMDEDAPKARSSVTKAQLEKTRSSGNPFQALSLLPGVNSTSNDATGLFGGGLRVRGFNSDQMGFTVNGAPVNDSGNFAVFPQEYVDQENLCSLYITQGAPDTDAPHVGAVGGNVGIWSCAPEEKQRTRIAISGGQLGYFRTFARVDTGKVGDFKAFLSASLSKANKWKGPGRADRKHLDFGAEYDLGAGNKISASMLYNRAVNNNFATFNQTQWAANGYYADYTSNPPQHVTPVGGTRQADTSPSPQYFGYALNPFENYLLTAKANFTLTDRLRLEVLPYLWRGLGTGGVQQTTLAESTSGTAVHGGIADINGDGDRLDTVLVYRGSLTNTYRPGITTTLTYALDHHRISGGVWLERARHRQTQPAVRVDNDGNVADIWLGSNKLTYVDGAKYQGRDWSTISTGQSVFVQDTIDLLDNKLQITPAFSYRRLKRDFSNYANSGANAGASYDVDQTYGKSLPSLAVSYQATDRLQAFTSVAKNFRTPSNFEYGNVGKGITFVNGVGTVGSLQALTIKPEQSVNFDLGARYKGDMFRGSATAFYNKFKDRIASSFDPIEGISRDINVGNSTTKGLEIEAGTIPWNGFSGYASLTYTKSTIDDSVISRLLTPAGAACTVPSATCTAVPYPTAGKIFPDTPKGMAGLSVQYAEGPYLLNIGAKYTSGRFLTLTNDTAIAAYTLFDLNAAWKLPNPSGNGFKNPIIRLNVSNLFNKQYFMANAGSGSNVTVVNGGVAGAPFYYAGAPRFTSLTFQVDY